MDYRGIYPNDRKYYVSSEYLTVSRVPTPKNCMKKDNDSSEATCYKEIRPKSDAVRNAGQGLVIRKIQDEFFQSDFWGGSAGLYLVVDTG